MSTDNSRKIDNDNDNDNDNNDNDNDNDNITDRDMCGNIKKADISESYMNDMHYENIHECVVESLKIIKMHIKEKSLRMGQKIEYGDIFDFLFK